MHYFRMIVFSSIFAGIIAGTAVTGAQLVSTVPLILKAEVFENAAPAHSEALATAELAESPADHDHHQAQEAWEPADGVERTSFTLLANILTATGWAMLLSGLMMLRGKPVGWREGLSWGLAGFVCVMLAPMAGLPPELPGMPVAPLADRQLWWIYTAIATAASIALVCFKPKPWSLAFALALVASPHIIGAPTLAENEATLVPALLEYQFIAAAVMTSLLSWLMIGYLSAFFLQRFQREA